MTDRDTLLSAILDDPSDDNPRLVLADLLRESDDPDAQARGRLLWAGVTASRFRDYDGIADPLYHTATGEIAAVTSAGHPARWLSELGLGPRPLTGRDWLWDSAHDRASVRVGGTVGTFTRGMLSELTVTLDDWYAVAVAALAVWPVERAVISDVPGLSFEVVNRGGDLGWLLQAFVRLPRTPTPPAPASIPPAADADNWAVYSDRHALASRVVAQSAQMVVEMQRDLGERWPSPPLTYL